jgi:tetratricopeptide (TPR) repeat protein
MSTRHAIAIVAVFGAVGLWPIPLAAQGTTADNHIAYYERVLQRNPRDGRTWLRLGDAMIRKARETGDLAYFGRAEQALRRSLEVAPDNAGALRHLAYVFYSRHQFAEAVEHAGRAVEVDRADGDAWGVLGDAYLELGRYDDAERAYRAMLAAKEDLYSLSRRAGLKTVRGDTGGAATDLRQAVAIGKASRQPPESIAWAQWQLGSDHFGQGKLGHAEASFQASLETLPGYHRALAGLAQVRAAQGRGDEAVELYRKALGVIPLPEYAAALGDVYRALGRQDDARRQYDMVEYMGRLSELNQIVYNRELAYFYADHDIQLDRALALARRELEARRDVYAWDVLAWTLHKNGQHDDAAAAIAEALRPGTRDARLFFHAGMIARGRGRTEEARRYLGQALSLNPHFHLVQADQARKILAELDGAHTKTVKP